MSDRTDAAKELAQIAKEKAKEAARLAKAAKEKMTKKCPYCDTPYKGHTQCPNNRCGKLRPR